MAKEGVGVPSLPLLLCIFVVPPVWGVKEGQIKKKKKDSSIFNLITVLSLKAINLQFIILSYGVKLEKPNLYPFHSIHLYYNYQTRVEVLFSIPLLNSQTIEWHTTIHSILHLSIPFHY